MMQRRCAVVSLILLGLSLSGHSLAVAAGATPRDAVKLYFEASKAGDVETIKQVIGGSFYNRRRVLLEENEEYSMFLREYYQGAQLQVGNVAMKDDVGVVTVRIWFPAGTVDTQKLLVKMDSAGLWIIVDEVH